VIYLALISSLFSIVGLIVMLRPLFLIQLFSLNADQPISILYSGFEWLAHPASGQALCLC
jgi:ABC-type spermidine/putrescine transport system permease subunit II